MAESYYLQVVNELFLLLEDCLEFSKSGLHLLQGELVLTLAGLILGHPGVELSDGVVQESPLLDQGVHLLHPGVSHTLDLDIALSQGSDLSIRVLEWIKR